jgi:hypothetical protein
MQAMVTWTCHNFMLYVHCLCSFDGPLVVTWLKRLGAHLSVQSTRVHPMPFHVRFVVEEVAQGQVLLQFSPVTIILPMLNAALSPALYIYSNWQNCHTIYIHFMRPASWSSGQCFWLLIMRYQVRFPALPWVFFPDRGGSPWWPWSG